LENNSRKPRDLTRNRHSGSLKKSHYFSGDDEKGDVIVIADDDEVRTCVSQNRVTATLCMEELFLRTQYLYIALSSYQLGKNGEGGGRKQTVNTTLELVLAVLSPPS
jgi:hypothetical protein